MSAVSVAGGAGLYLGANQSIGSLAGAGTVSSYAGPGATLTVGNDNTDTTFSGTMSDYGQVPLAVTKVGAGTLTLTGNNTFTGTLTVKQGGLVEGAGPAGTGLVANVINSATFIHTGGTFAGRLTNSGLADFGDEDFTLGNGLENDGTAYCSVNLTLNGAGLNNTGTFSTTSFTALSLAGAPTNANSGSLTLAALTQLVLGTSTLSNSGGLYLNGAVVTGTGPLNNNFGGVIYGPGTIETAFNNSGGLLSVANGTTIVSQAFSNSGTIQVGGGNLTSGAITNLGTINGQGNIASPITNTASGTIEAMGGILNLGGTLANQAGGLIAVDAGAKLIATPGLATNAGIINLTGGTFDNNGHPLNNTGQISGWGIFRTGGSGLDNNGSITFSGGLTTINGPVTNENGKTIVVAYNPAIFTGLVTNAGTGTFNVIGTTVVFAGGSSGNVPGAFANAGGAAFGESGSGVIEVDGPPSLGNSSSIAVSASSTLRFKANSGSATIGTGVTVTIASGGTLELAGSVSALSSGANRVNITNSSSPAGILISGTHQQVGNIDGPGTTQVNAGSDLTANHIIQSALVIGGTMGNTATVTIVASDSSGNPLGQADAEPTRMPVEMAIGDEMSGAAFVGGPGNSAGSLPLGAEGFSGDPIPAAGGAPSNSPSAPEPSALLLVALALAVGLANLAARRVS
jgi:autotransporter-associated beta strand protein